jgi:hypothetical protein
MWSASQSTNQITARIIASVRNILTSSELREQSSNFDGFEYRLSSFEKKWLRRVGRARTENAAMGYMGSSAVHFIPNYGVRSQNDEPVPRPALLIRVPVRMMGMVILR